MCFIDTRVGIEVGFFFFFISGFSFKNTDDSQDSKGRKGPPNIFSSTLPLQSYTEIQIFICIFQCEMAITYL